MAERSKEDILKLIKKIQKLTDPNNNPTEGEMQAAAARIQHLLKVYNLTTADVSQFEDKDEKNKSTVDIGNHATVERKRSSLPRFEQNLASMVAKACECSWFLSQKRGKSKNGKWGTRSYHLRFVGVEIDCIVAAELYNYLCKTIYKLSRKYFDTCAEQNSFWYGALLGLAEKFKENEEKIEEEYKKESGKYEMVLADKNALVERHMNELDLRTIKSRGAGTTRPSDIAYNAGYIEGGNLDTSTGRHLE